MIQPQQTMEPVSQDPKTQNQVAAILFLWELQKHATPKEDVR